MPIDFRSLEFHGLTGVMSQDHHDLNHNNSDNILVLMEFLVLFDRLVGRCCCVPVVIGVSVLFVSFVFVLLSIDIVSMCEQPLYAVFALTGQSPGPSLRKPCISVFGEGGCLNCFSCGVLSL